jgi:elongation factor 3
VKLVLAAAMWNLPHLIVLDEPTNFLDREALGALATAIKEFQGGVIMISHGASGAPCLTESSYSP